ncbi:hypothetical protein EYF80_020331 [Liparis tanakae]|uniref:Uncharacterized protein n=1 Tax=Liparis tanakae TaxID=230148 RepID=A0A4Z2HUX5_9TELE|nr:hypothetical protein EYF80_020331 [Liparis tanakae]
MMPSGSDVASRAISFLTVTPGLPPLCCRRTGVSLRTSLGHSGAPSGVSGSCCGFSSPARST